MTMLEDLREVVRLMDQTTGLEANHGMQIVWASEDFIRTHAAQIEQDARDAERYQWLRRMYRSASPHMDGTFEHRQPMHSFRARTFDEAIDAAMAKESGNGY